MNDMTLGPKQEEHPDYGGIFLMDTHYVSFGSEQAGPLTPQNYMLYTKWRPKDKWLWMGGNPAHKNMIKRLYASARTKRNRV